MKAVAGAGTGRIPCAQCTCPLPVRTGGGNAFRCEHFDQRAAGNNICNGIKRTDLVKMHKLNGNAVGMTLRFCNQFVNSKGMLFHCIGHGQRTDNVFNFVQPVVKMVMLVFMTVLVLMAMLMRVFMLMFMFVPMTMLMRVLILMAMLMFVKVFMFVHAGGIFVRIGVHVFNGKMNSANAAFFRRQRSEHSVRRMRRQLQYSETRHVVLRKADHRVRPQAYRPPHPFRSQGKVFS